MIVFEKLYLYLRNVFVMKTAYNISVFYGKHNRYRN